MWSIIIICQMEEELLNRNHFFHRRTDKQTAMVKPDYLQNFVGGGKQTYFPGGEIVENLPPWRSKCHGGVTFSRPLVHNFMLKFEPCQLLTLQNDRGVIFNVENDPGVIFNIENDPGSHFSTGSLFNVTATLSAFNPPVASKYPLFLATIWAF